MIKPDIPHDLQLRLSMLTTVELSGRTIPCLYKPGYSMVRGKQLTHDIYEYSMELTDIIFDCGLDLPVTNTGKYHILLLTLFSNRYKTSLAHNEHHNHHTPLDEYYFTVHTDEQMPIQIDWIKCCE